MVGTEPLVKRRFRDRSLGRKAAFLGGLSLLVAPWVLVTLGALTPDLGVDSALANEAYIVAIFVVPAVAATTAGAAVVLGALGLRRDHPDRGEAVAGLLMGAFSLVIAAGWLYLWLSLA